MTTSQIARLAIFLAAAVFSETLLSGAQASPVGPEPRAWHLSPAARTSLALEPVRVDAMSGDGLRLALKRYARPGAQPVVLIHGLAQNDRGWDPAMPQYSFARYLHSQGFDVWVGNLRGAGTQGFRSETPAGPHHWSIDDYAIHDVSGLIEEVRSETGQAPFVVGHSLAAWALEGYFAGLSYGTDGSLRARASLGLARQEGIRGLVTIAGVYNLRWEHSVRNAASHPIRTAIDYYHSNYELELLSRAKPLFHVIPTLTELPLGWIGRVLSLPVEKIPYIGEQLRQLYLGAQADIIRSPVLNMFYYAPNVDADLVRRHAADGLEDLGPHVIEQLGNAVNDRQTSSYYHLNRPDEAYDYARVRARIKAPMFFVAGGRDRLASALEIYEDGFLKTNVEDKEFLHVEAFGHMDILTGIRAPAEVMAPVTRWMRQRM